MAHTGKIVTVFGGSGFVGRQVVKQLAEIGMTVKVVSRVPERANFLKTCGTVGQVVPVFCDYSDIHSVRTVLKGSDYAVNCVAILYERGRKNVFQAVHVDFAVTIAKSCTEEGVERLVHISSLSCEKGTSTYAKTKYEGEKALSVNFPRATILRPSVIFGQDDAFFNKFAELSRFAPVLPLIGGGKTKFQPVYVGDVARAVICSLTLSDDAVGGKVYQLGGPEVMNFKQIYQIIFKYTKRRRILMPIPFGLMKVKAFFLGLLPNPVLTCDQVESLKTDNVVDDGALSFNHLGIEPKAVALVVPSYLESYRAGGRFADAKQV